MDIEIRAESDRDFDEIRRVIETAFVRSVFGYNGEADLVDLIRTCHADDTISTVAEVDSQLVGHLFFSPVELKGAFGTLTGMGMGPLAVTPDFQNRGVGSALIVDGLRRLKEADASYVVVLGDAEFYERFGFRQASELAVLHGFKGISQEHFLCQSLSEKFDGFSGRAYYVPEFGPQHVGS